MKDKKLGKGGLYFLILLGLGGQVGTSYTVYEFNQTAGQIIALLFVYIDVGLFVILGMASNAMSDGRDKGVLYSSAIFIGLFAVGTIYQAILTADHQKRYEARQELAAVSTDLAKSAGIQASLSSAESKNRMLAADVNKNRQSQYTNQAAEHGKNAVKSLDQAGALVRKAEKLIEAPTRRELGMANLSGWKKDVYVIWAALIVVLIPSLTFHYAGVFSRRIDEQNSGVKTKTEGETQNQNKTKTDPKPTGTEPEKKNSSKTDSEKPKPRTKKPAPSLKLVTPIKTDLKLELARKWVLNTSEKINVANLMAHMKKRKEGVSNASARTFLKSMCEGDEPILKRTSSAANAGFIKIREEMRAV